MVRTTDLQDEPTLAVNSSPILTPCRHLNIDILTECSGEDTATYAHPRRGPPPSPSAGTPPRRGVPARLAAPSRHRGLGAKFTATIFSGSANGGITMTVPRPAGEGTSLPLTGYSVLRNVIPPQPPPDVPPGWELLPPDFVGVGTMKSGTSWWWSILASHPDVASPRGSSSATGPPGSLNVALLPFPWVA